MSKASDRAYRFIRGEIVAGALRPGTPLREEALAEACGVSRTPVREAMRKLEAEQLIQRTKSQRSFVASQSFDEIAEAFTLRAMLEGHAAARAAERIRAGVLDRLLQCNMRMRDAVERSQPDVATFLDGNRALHAMVLEAADSPRLAMLVGSIVEQPVVLRTALRYSREQLVRSVAEHDELIEAIRQNDSDWALAVMTAHIRRALHTYRGAFQPRAVNDVSA